MNTKEVLRNWDDTSKKMYFLLAENGFNTWSDEYREIANKWFTNKDLTGISYRTINYWDEKGYLTGLQNQGSKWRKFDFVQLIWIQFLEKCRQMGVSLEMVIPVIFNSYGYIPKVSDAEKAELVKDLDDKEKETFQKLYGSYLDFQSIFRFWVFFAILRRKAVSIRFYADGSCSTMVGTEKKLGNTKDDFVNSQSFISISLNELIRDFIEQQPINVLESTSILAKEELDVIKHLRDKSLNELTVHFENGVPVRIETTSHQPVELNKRIYEYITSPYEKLEVKTNGGTSAYIRKTKSIKLK
jgi:hypothetical protein